MNSGSQHSSESCPAQPASSGEVHNPAADLFFSAAIPRILRFILILGALLTTAVAWHYGWRTALGFAAGTIMSYFSFRSLNRGVASLLSRVVAEGRPQSAFSLINGFFLRYLLAGIVAYVIFTSSPKAFRGFLFGLLTPVAAMSAEAGYEAYAALRRGY